MPSSTTLVLGGGFKADGTLTDLSRQRLDAAARLYHAGQAPHLCVTGRLKPDQQIADAHKRAAYLQELGVPTEAILPLTGGSDTIGEALVFRDTLPDVQALTVITSSLHVPRSRWIFETVLGNGITLSFQGVDCGGILLADEEAAYLAETQAYFAETFGILENTENWHARHAALYARFKAVHDRFHPAGNESQAYGPGHPLHQVK